MQARAPYSRRSARDSQGAQLGQLVQRDLHIRQLQGMLEQATQQAAERQNFLAEVGFAVKGATPIFCDNTAAKTVAENPVAAKQLRHVERRHFFVQDVVSSGRVTVPHVESEANLADALTKLLPTAAKFEWAASRLRSWTMGS